MKQRLLCLLLGIMGALGLTTSNAQTWTDATLTNNTRYVFENVGSGRFLGPSNSWGTQASLIEASHFNVIHTTATTGVYTLESQVSNGGTNYYFTGTYMDGAATNLTIQSATIGGETLYSIQVGGNYIGYDGSSTVLATNAARTSNNFRWRIVAYDDYLSDATSTNPKDATYRILDANFDRNNRYGGGANNDKGNQWTMVASNQNLCGGTNENKCAESWRATFTLSQNIAVPNGYYKVRAQAALTEYTVTGADFPVVYATSGANTVTTPFLTMQHGEGSMDGMSNQFTNGLYYTAWTGQVTVTNGSLTVGVKGTRTDTWCIWDNIQLQYLGPLDLSGLAADLAVAVAAAQATEGTIPTALYNNISTVVTQYNKTYNTPEEYTTAINAINNAVTTNATAAIVAAYSKYLKIRAAVVALDDDATVFTETVAPVSVADADAAANAATTVAGIEAAISLLRADATTFLDAVHSVIDMTNNKYLNITAIYLENPDFSDGTIGGWETNYVSGEQANNIGYQGASYTNNGVTISQFIEAWRNGAALGNGYLRQTVSGLPEGKYTLEADAIAVWQAAPATVTTGAYLYINADGVDFRTSMNTGNNAPEHFSTEFVSPGNVAISFGIKTESTNANWMCADNFVVKFYGLDLSPYATTLAGLVAQAQALYGHVPTSYDNALRTAVSTYGDDSGYTSSSEYATAIAALQTAIDNASPFRASFDRYLAMRALVVALDDDATKFDVAATVDVTAADAQAYGATTTAAVEAAIPMLKTAAATFLGAVEMKDGEYLDITNIFLTNADFSAGNIDGWETNYVSGTQANNIGYQVGAGGTDPYVNGDVSIYQFIEAWRAGNAAIGDGYLRQTVSGLPEGKYTLEADAIAVNQGNAAATTTGTYLYIYGDSQYFRESLSTGNALPEHFSTEFLSTGSGDVTFGLMTESTTANWIAADNFRVKFWKLDLTPAANLLREKVAQAEALEGTVPTAVFTTLMGVVAANNGDTHNYDYDTYAEYLTAIANIDAAIVTASAMQAPYARYKDVRTKVLAVNSGINVSTADSQAEAATTAAGIETAVATVRQALADFLPTADVATYGGSIDVTDALIDNPSPGTAGNDAYWTTSGNVGGDYNLREYWSQSGVTYMQTLLPSMPAGAYKLTAVAYTRTGFNATLKAGTNTQNLATVAQSEINSLQGGNNWIAQGNANGVTELPFSLAAATANLEIGITAGTNTADYWTVWRSFKLEYVGATLVPVTGITLSETALAMVMGQTATVTATATPANAVSTSMRWTTSDAAVATVSGGTITAVGEGTATITVTDVAYPSITATVTVTVTIADVPTSYATTLVPGTDYYIMNAASGQFLGGGHNWGTQASLIEHGVPFTLAAGTGEDSYTLDSHYYNTADGHFFSGTFVDGGATDLYITSLGGGKFSIATRTHDDENNVDVDHFVIGNPSTLIVDNSAADASSLLSQWYFLSKADRDADLPNATPASPVDATYYIKEANISRNLRTADGVTSWVGEHAEGQDTELGRQNYNAERFHNVTNVYQTVTGLTNGDYLLRCQGFYRADAGSTQPSYLFGNEESVALSPMGTLADQSMQGASVAFTAGRYWNEVEVAVTEGELTIAIRTEDVNNWTIWDNFELYLKHPYNELDLAKARLQNKINHSPADHLANVGTGAFQYANASLADALATAQTAHDAAAATVKSVDDARGTLETAIEAFKTINVPAAGTAYNFVLRYNGYEHDGKAITFIANAREDAGLYNIQYYAAPQPYLAQAFTMTRVSGNQYKMSQRDVDGNERYICLGTVYNGSTSQIRTTTNADDAAVFEIIPDATRDGIFHIWNVADNQYIGSQDAGMYTVNSHVDFNIAQTQKVSVPVTVNADYDFSTLILPFDAPYPEGWPTSGSEGAGAYKVVDINGGSIVLEREADKFHANVPYIIYAPEGLSETLENWGAALQDTYATDYLNGGYVTRTAPAGSYVLSAKTYTSGNTTTKKVGFYRLTKDTEVPAYKAYFTIPAASPVKAEEAFFFSGFGDETAIGNVGLGDQKVEGIYNVNGVKTDRLLRGTNIIRMADGSVRKVIVK